MNAVREIRRMKKSCCKKYKRKAKACKGCPLVHALGCKRRSKNVRRSLKQWRKKERKAA